MNMDYFDLRLLHLDREILQTQNNNLRIMFLRETRQFKEKLLEREIILERIENEKKELRAENERLQQEVDLLKSKNEISEQKFDKINNIIRESIYIIESQIGKEVKIKTEKGRLNIEIALFKQKFEQHKNKIHDLNKNIQKTINIIVQKTKEGEQSKVENERLNKEIVLLKQKIGESKQKIDVLNSNIQEKINIIQQKTEEEKKNKTENQKLNKEMELLKQKIEKSEKKIEDLNSNIKTKINVIEQKTEEEKQSKAENDRLTQELRESDNVINLRKEIEKILKIKIESLSEELKLSNEKCKQNEKKISSLKEDLRQKMDEVNTLCIQINEKFVLTDEKNSQTDFKSECQECSESKMMLQNTLRLLENYAMRVDKLNEQIRNQELVGLLKHNIGKEVDKIIEQQNEKIEWLSKELEMSNAKHNKNEKIIYFLNEDLRQKADQVNSLEVQVDQKLILMDEKITQTDFKNECEECNESKMVTQNTLSLLKNYATRVARLNKQFQDVNTKKAKRRKLGFDFTTQNTGKQL